MTDDMRSEIEKSTDSIFLCSWWRDAGTDSGHTWKTISDFLHGALILLPNNTDLQTELRLLIRLAHARADLDAQIKIMQQRLAGETKIQGAEVTALIYDEAHHLLYNLRPDATKKAVARWEKLVAANLPEKVAKTDLQSIIQESFHDQGGRK